MYPSKSEIKYITISSLNSSTFNELVSLSFNPQYVEIVDRVFVNLTGGNDTYLLRCPQLTDAKYLCSISNMFNSSNGTIVHQLHNYQPAETSFYRNVSFDLLDINEQPITANVKIIIGLKFIQL